MICPHFLSGPSGRLYANLYLLEENKIPNSWVLYLPAFAEEMNKSRHMINQQADRFASLGHAVIVADLYGTGDSGGDFGDSSWECWKRDVRYLISWARQQGAKRITLWGLRLGALMAVEIALSEPDEVDQLLLWQPVMSGQQAMTQFLRLRMAAGLMGPEVESVSQLRERLASGETLEIAGYGLSSELFSQVSLTSMADLLPPEGAKLNLFWFEVVQSEERPLNLQAKKLVENWRGRGVNVHAETVVGEPFWTTQELSNAPALIERTTAILSSETSVLDFKLRSIDSSYNELPCVFDCEGSHLIGVLHKTNARSNRAILVVVGGPQYRVGSHRQFVLLARNLATNGSQVFRFDYRGMGDSGGIYQGFEHIQDDIKAAIDKLMDVSPETTEVVIWGLCDAATAACFYAINDPRVSGLVLLNPWVRSEQGEARAFVKHYYLKRLLSKSFWGKVFTGKFNVNESFSSLNKNVKNAAATAPAMPNASNDISTQQLNIRLEKCLQRFSGNVLFILSENDLTAAEFKDAVKSSKSFQKLVHEPRFVWREISGADHTFSKSIWREQVAENTTKWLRSW